MRNPQLAQKTVEEARDRLHHFECFPEVSAKSLLIETDETFVHTLEHGCSRVGRFSLRTSKYEGTQRAFSE